MITHKEVLESKKNFTVLMVKWFLVSLFGFWSTLVVWEFVFKNVLKIPGYYVFMNDTKDGDYGADWWLEDKGLKPGLLSALLWWKRNHSWNYIMRYPPSWAGGSVDRDENGDDEFLILELTIPEEQMYDSKGRYNRFTKASSTKGILGVNHFVYRLDGKVWFNYSKATKYYKVQFGAGGNEYRYHIKLNLENIFK